MCHFIGLGNVSCNLLKDLMFSEYEAHYTFVSSVEHSQKSFAVEYVKWNYTEIYVDSGVMTEKVTIPERLRIRIMTHPDNRISACLGESDGIFLAKGILNYQWPEVIDLKYLFFIPPKYKDENQEKLTSDFIKIYKEFEDVCILPFPPLGN